MKRDDFAATSWRATVFESERDVKRSSRSIAANGNDAADVNAYLQPQMNDINFPAGVLAAAASSSRKA